jgi:hypothetical protein
MASDLEDAASLCSLQDGEHGGHTTEMKQTAEMKQTTAVGGNMLVVSAAETEKVTEFAVSSAEPIGGTEFLEAPHKSGESAIRGLRPWCRCRGNRGEFLRGPPLDAPTFS